MTASLALLQGQNGDLFSLENTPEFRSTNKTKKSNEKPTRRGRKRTYHKDRPSTPAERFAAFCKRKKQSIHFKSNSIEWSTPEETFKALDEEFHFTLDVCADESNTKCPIYFTKEQDGLRQRWIGVCWCNPPYGKDISRWIQKAYESSLFGSTVVCLVPSRTDAQWWQNYVLPLPQDNIIFLPGRQYFSGKGRAPFPSAVVIFRGVARDINHGDQAAD